MISHGWKLVGEFSVAAVAPTLTTVTTEPPGECNFICDGFSNLMIMMLQVGSTRSSDLKIYGTNSDAESAQNETIYLNQEIGTLQHATTACGSFAAGDFGLSQAYTNHASDGFTDVAAGANAKIMGWISRFSRYDSGEMARIGTAPSGSVFGDFATREYHVNNGGANLGLSCMTMPVGPFSRVCFDGVTDSSTADLAVLVCPFN